MPYGVRTTRGNLIFAHRARIMDRIKYARMTNITHPHPPPGSGHIVQFRDKNIG
jgi:hypothetical protein